MEGRIAVKRVKELSFFVDEKYFIPDPQKYINVQLGLSLSHAISQNMVSIFSRVYYHYIDSPPNQILADINVQNVFQVENLNKFRISDYEIQLPSNLITTLVSVSFSHTRALFARNLSGTAYQDVYMDILDADKLAKHFFPKMFEAVLQPATPSSGPVKKSRPVKRSRPVKAQTKRQVVKKAKLKKKVKS